MTEEPYRESPSMSRAIYRLYREFFDLSERRRRWTLQADVPWHQCNSSLNPAIADVVESFCAVELFLPDYVAKMLPQIRASRGRAWFAINWGYEESKHSLALSDWLLRSGHRSEEDVEDFQDSVLDHEWSLPMDNMRGMLCYSMMQEMATWLNYRNLRLIVGRDDPALHTLLGFIMVDERAHYTFFVKLMRLHLAEDRAGTLEQLRRVMNNFAMPALHMLVDGRRRIEAVKSLGIFDDNVFYQDVYLPILADLGVDRQEMRRRNRRESSGQWPVASVEA